MDRPVRAEPFLDQSTFMVVVRTLVDELRSRLSREHALETCYLEGDDRVERESLLVACAIAGVDPDDYRRSLEEDGNLFQLHRWAVTETFCGTSDPGPYDRISPESSTGTEPSEFRD